MVTITVSLALLLSTGVTLEELKSSTLPALAVRRLAEQLELWGFDVTKPIALQEISEGTFRLTQ